MKKHYDANLFSVLKPGMVKAVLIACLVAMGMAGTASAGQLSVDLMAGQNIDAGDVLVEIIDFGDTEELCVTYVTDAGWELDEYHLWIGTDLADMPKTKKGSPKLGKFPYKETGLSEGEIPVTIASVCIPFDDPFNDLCDLSNLIVVAHAVVTIDTDADGIPDSSETGFGNGYDLGGRSWAMGFDVPLCSEEVFDAEGLESDLEDASGENGLVGLKVKYNGGSSSLPYLSSDLDYDEDGTLDQTGLNTYCVDLDNGISPGVDYCALFVSSYDPAVESLSAILNPGNLDLANYVLNTYAIGDTLGGATVTGGDIQRTLWALVHGTRVNVGAYGSGASSDATVDAILADAAANGEGYTPPCDGFVAVILYPVSCSNPDGIVAQALIAQALVSSFPSTCGSVCTVCTE